MATNEIRSADFNLWPFIFQGNNNGNENQAMSLDASLRKNSTWVDAAASAAAYQG